MAVVLDVVIAAESERRFAELCRVLTPLPVRALTPHDVLGQESPTVEDPEGIAKAAERRARQLSKSTGMVTIAEVSGLCVDALGGRPGLRSTRFSGDRATDAENNAALLAALEEFDDDDRAAHFRCVIAMKSPWSDDVEVVEGRLDGRIARTARGSGGFGYEPLFLVEDGDAVVAELEEGKRRELSAHARAARALTTRLVATIDRLLDDACRVLA